MSINKVAQDYGHGVNPDIGAVGIITEESVINNIASHVDVQLHDRGVEVVWTRPTSVSSVNDSLNQRISKANANNVDLFISHHANMAQGNGHEIWVIGLGGEAEAYAKKVDRALTKLGSNSRGVKVGNLAVLRGTNTPAILIEYFFLDTQSNVDFYNRVGAYAYAKSVVRAILGDEPQVEEHIIEENPIQYGTIKVNSVLNVRDGASTNSSIIGQLANGQKVKIDERYSTDIFYNIYYGNSGGFVHKDYVKLD
ncbi:N-acetylmuramoyl-L-alanine amidase [Clostridium putrefaciens]|uniref:N-acetylmuramoyl-L-alanine amidase n=1 Tax=Clostridium putrefaciens TaxID=99675 RepID=A0A381J9J9_9CLOT|nr:N-acetylmuramoyl-L-alanine amidase [Clostridium putrefaciens]SUY47042.1 N-acetylmuramoyl-L-alanine amidase [Clostridium putrefaciens]